MKTIFRRVNTMDIVLTKEEGLLREFSVTVSYDMFLTQEREKIVSVSKKVKLDGFRPGKAPAALVKAQYGERIKGEVFRDLFENTTRKIIAEHGLNVAGPATVDIAIFKEQEPIVLYCALEVIPEAPLIDIKSLDMPKYVFLPSAEQIQARVSKLKFLLSGKTSLDRPSDYGDTVIYREFSFDHETGDEADDTESFFVTISQDDPDTHKFLGRSAGDHFHFDEPCHEDHDHSHHHHHDHRHVDVLGVVSLSDPLQDARIQKAFEGVGLEKGLYNAAKTELILEKRDLSVMTRRADLLQTLENRYVFPLPQVMIEAEKRQILENDPESDEDPDDYVEKMARRRVALAFLFLKYAGAHGIEVTNQDVAKALFDEVDGDKKELFKAVENLKNNPRQMAAFKNNILEEKVIETLLRQVTGTTRYVLFRDFILEKQTSFLQFMKNSVE